MDAVAWPWAPAIASVQVGEERMERVDEALTETK
jgi:hypothetical protein